MLNSIRTKLFVSFVAIGIGPLLLLMMFILSSVHSNEKIEMHSKMLREANIISTHLSDIAYFENTSNIDSLETIQAVLKHRFMIMNNKGEVTYDSNHFEEGKLNSSGPLIRILQGKEKHIQITDEQSVAIYTPIYNSDYKEVLGVTVILGDYTAIDESVDRLMTIGYLIIIALSLIILITTFYFSGSLTKPFSLFLKHLNRVSEGYIDEKLEITGNYEIEEIGIAFNQMLGKIAEIDTSRQQFVANVSHELKTPLSSMKVLAESLLSMDDAPIEYYIEFMEDINSEVDRETQIINDLLTLVTLDKTASKLNTSTLNVNGLIEQVMRMLKPVAEKKNVELEIKSFRQVVADIDETKLYLVLMNLIENAIKYNEDDGKVTVTINSDHREFTVKISDSGIGIPKDQLDKVFERFYRVDKNRSRDTGGTGLGLSIVHKTVVMHGGSIKCHSEEGVGTTFTLKMPLAQPQFIE